MNYKIVDVNTCTKKLSFNLGNVDLKPHIQKALQQKQKTSELKGYRKGKAPISVIEQFYGPQVENEALSRFIYEQIDIAVKNEGINPVDYPRIEKADYKAPELSFDALVEFFPKISLKDLSKYSFKQDIVEVTPADIADAKDKYLKSRTTLEIVSDNNYVAKNGDYVQLNFQGTLKDGSQPENMKGTDYPLELGTGSFIKGFEEGLIGLKKDTKKDLKLKFPHEYHVEKLRDQEVTFHVEILAIKQKKTPTLSNELAQELGFENLEQMETTIVDTIKTQKTRAAREKLEKDILDKLAEDHPFDVPVSMIAGQKKSLEEQVIPGLTRSGFNENQIREYLEKWDEDMTKRAKFQVQTAFILDQISKDYKVEATPQDIENKYNEIAASANMKVEEVKNFYKKDQKNYRNLFFNVKEQKTFTKILEIVKLN